MSAPVVGGGGRKRGAAGAAGLARRSKARTGAGDGGAGGEASSSGDVTGNAVGADLSDEDEARGLPDANGAQLDQAADTRGGRRGGGASAQHDAARRPQGPAAGGEAMEGPAAGRGTRGSPGPPRNRWRDEHFTALVRQVTEVQPLARGVRSDEKRRRWELVCSRLQAMEMFRCEVSVSSAKQQLKKTLKWARADILGRDNAAADAEGDGERSDLQRAHRALLRLIDEGKEPDTEEDGPLAQPSQRGRQPNQPHDTTHVDNVVDSLRAAIGNTPRAAADTALHGDLLSLLREGLAQLREERRVLMDMNQKLTTAMIQGLQHLSPGSAAR